MKKRGKKAQFYILAAIIIIFVLIGIFVYGNYAKTKNEYSKIYDLGEELNIETGYVYDYGVYNSQNTDSLIENWSTLYYNYTKDVVENWVFIYGNKENATILYFTKDETACVTLNFGSGPSKICTQGYIKGKKSISLSSSNEIAVLFENVNYPFKLEEGENFFFIIRGGEYTAT